MRDLLFTNDGQQLLRFASLSFSLVFFLLSLLIVFLSWIRFFFSLCEKPSLSLAKLKRLETKIPSAFFFSWESLGLFDCLKEKEYSLFRSRVKV